MSTKAPPEIEAIKARIKAVWTAGDFGVIAHQVEDAEQAIVDRLAVAPGTKVLDVACGTGNTAVPTARRGADVIGVDIAPNLLEQARERARSENLSIRFVEGDAEDLQFPDASFDLVISIFGAMFAPRPEVMANELIRVCRPGGRIVMGNWTPESFAGQTFRLTAKYIPPPPALVPPILWGDESVVRQRLRDGIAKLDIHRRTVIFRLPFDEAHAVEHYRKYFGPTIRTFEALDPAGQEAFRAEYEAVWKANNTATDGTIVVPSDFLEVVATRE